MRRLVKVLSTAYLLLCLGFAVLADEMLAVSSSPWFYVIAAASLLPVVELVRRERLVRLVTLGYIVLLLFLPFFSFTPVKPFRQFYWSIHKGMTPPEVSHELDRQFASNGRFPRPGGGTGDESGCFQLDPNSRYYNAELIVVKMVDICLAG